MTANILLITSALPYLGFTGYDLWMHKHDRPVPKREHFLHAIILPLVILFLICASLGLNVYATIVVTIAFPCMIADELIYHQDLHAKEKLIHLLAGLSLMAFIVVWVWMT